MVFSFSACASSNPANKALPFELEFRQSYDEVAEKLGEKGYDLVIKPANSNDGYTSEKGIFLETKEKRRNIWHINHLPMCSHLYIISVLAKIKNYISGLCFTLHLMLKKLVDTYNTIFKTEAEIYAESGDSYVYASWKTEEFCADIIVESNYDIILIV